MEKIIRVEEALFKTGKSDWNSYEGYQVITTEQTIKVGISSGQACCENFGYMTTNDNLKDFESADLISVEVVDKSLNVKTIEERGFEEDDAMFVNFNTTKGVMQLVAYNSHNGYYGHDAVLITKDTYQSRGL